MQLLKISTFVMFYMKVYLCIRYQKNGQSLLVLLPSEEPEMIKVLFFPDSDYINDFLK